VASTAVATAFGPSLGGLLVEWDGWRLVFLLNLPVGGAAIYYAVRILSEDRESARLRVPDFLGVVLVTLALGLLALAIVQGNEWGWTSAGVLGAFAGAALLLPAFVWRTLHHETPVVDPALLKLRSLSVANAATFVYGIAFYATLLCNILFLTGVWGYSFVEAGLALTPAPFAAAVSARVAGVLMERRSALAVTVGGVLAFAAACAWYAAQTGVEPDFVAQWLPGSLLGGAGAGFAFSGLAAAALVPLSPARLSVATGVLIVSRQVGAVLGVALLVAVVGTPAPADALNAFHEGWLLAVVASLAAALISFGLVGTRQPGAVSAPAPA
jgi:MFS transporter